MADQKSTSEEVIHFQCRHCGISLTVDDSLAGISGPCPSCGKNTTAPLSPEKEAAKKTLLPPRDDVKLDAGKSSPGQKSKPGGKEQRRRVIRQEPSITDPYRERGSMAKVFKTLITGLVFLVLVLAAAYWLYQRFNP